LQTVESYPESETIFAEKQINPDLQYEYTLQKQEELFTSVIEKKIARLTYETIIKIMKNQPNSKALTDDSIQQLIVQEVKQNLTVNNWNYKDYWKKLILHELLINYRLCNRKNYRYPTNTFSTHWRYIY
jgi:hypothetical protein